jgi:hypothetical protein
MLEIVVAFVLGMIVMDLLWAWKLGLLALAVHRVRSWFGRGKVDTGSDRL